MEYGQLEAGQIVSSHSYRLDSALVSDFVKAVQDDSGTLFDAEGHELVPAMAVAALSIRGVVKDLRIPGGTLHVGQEFEFSGAVAVGQSVDCVATLAQNSVRGDWRFLVVDCKVSRENDAEVMKGKSTIMIPADLGPREMGQ
ncbi:MAG: hypothetical protein F4Y49_10385 [Dehalococcoidia bacterium]|nr:hypothetical protein [Dehalococcoidia bacterium]